MSYLVIRHFPHEALAQMAVDILLANNIQAYHVGGNLGFTEMANMMPGIVEVRISDQDREQAEIILSDHGL